MSAKIVLTIALGLVAGFAASDDLLRVGISTVDITPPVVSRMSGYFRERLSTGTKDPLQAKVMVLQQGEARAALVFCDLIGMPVGITDRVRAEASKRSGIPTGRIGVACTHTHTGPQYYGTLFRLFRERAIAKHGKDPHGFDYAGLLVEKIASAVGKAAAEAAPATLEAGVAEERRLSFNRRFHMKEGPVRFNPGQQNPDIVRVAGPIDPDVGILLVKRDGKPVASLTAFALHLDTTGGSEFSADYPYYLEQGLREEFGESFCSMFGAGTCGDINHVDVTTEGRRSAAEIGGMLAGTVKELIPKLSAVEPALAVHSAKLNASLRKPEDPEGAVRRKPMIGTRELPFMETVKTCTSLDLQELPERLPLEVQVFRIGKETAIVLLPGEVFVDLGLAIKKASPYRNTLVIELANDNPVYIPTEKAFREGSYETVNSRIEPGWGEKMVETVVGLLGR